VVALLLLSEGINVNAANKDGYTPLHVASQNGHAEVAALLIQNKADVNAAQKYGHTPLHIASENDHARVAALLLRNSAIKVNASDKDKMTPLHVASLAGDVEIVRLLLAASDVLTNVEDAKKRTPRNLAAERAAIETDDARKQRFETIVTMLRETEQSRPIKRARRDVSAVERDRAREVVKLVCAALGVTNFSKVLEAARDVGLVNEYTRMSKRELCLRLAAHYSLPMLDADIGVDDIGKAFQDPIMFGAPLTNPHTIIPSGRTYNESTISSLPRPRRDPETREAITSWVPSRFAKQMADAHFERFGNRPLVFEAW
jgi:hypothetical protein